MELYEVRKSEDGMYYIYNASGILVADAYADYADETVYIMTYGHCTISTITGEEDMADNEDGLSVSVIGDEVVIKTYYDQVTVAR